MQYDLASNQVFSSCFNIKHSSFSGHGAGTIKQNQKECQHYSIIIEIVILCQVDTFSLDFENMVSLVTVVEQ